MFWHQKALLYSLATLGSTTAVYGGRHGKKHGTPTPTPSPTPAPAWRHDLEHAIPEAYYCGGFGIRATIPRDLILATKSNGWKTWVDEDGEPGIAYLSQQGQCINDKGGAWATLELTLHGDQGKKLGILTFYGLTHDKGKTYKVCHEIYEANVPGFWPLTLKCLRREPKTWPFYVKDLLPRQSHGFQFKSLTCPLNDRFSAKRTLSLNQVLELRLDGQGYEPAWQLMVKMTSKDMPEFQGHCAGKTGAGYMLFSFEKGKGKSVDHNVWFYAIREPNSKPTDVPTLLCSVYLFPSNESFLKARLCTIDI